MSQSTDASGTGSPLPENAMSWRMFTQVFKSFRIASHPYKLAISLLMVLAIYLAGTIMDWAWSGIGGRATLQGSMALYSPVGQRLVDQLNEQEAGIVNRLAAEELTAQRLDLEPNGNRTFEQSREQVERERAAFRERFEGRPERAIDDLLEKIDQSFDRRIREAEGRLAAAEEADKARIRDEISEQRRRRVIERERLINEFRLGISRQVFDRFQRTTAGRAGGIQAGAERPSTRDYRRLLQKINEGAVMALGAQFGREMGLAELPVAEEGKPDPREQPSRGFMFVDRYSSRPVAAVSEARRMIRQRAADRISDRQKRLDEAIANMTDDENRRRARAEAQEEMDRIRENRDRTLRELDQFSRNLFAGVFETWLGLGDEVVDRLRGIVPNPVLPTAVPADTPIMDRLTMVIDSLRVFLVTGPQWMLRAHPVYTVIFLPILLAIIAFLGGALARMMALHATRGQRVAAMDAVLFSQKRFLSFLLAPAIPILLVLGMGLLLMALGLLANLPVLEILVGIGFVVALLVAFVMALMLIGLAGGGPMLYPAIATEGTDAFDAIARAFNYLFSRPWRWLGLVLVSLVYAGITIIFVSWLLQMTRDMAIYFVASGVVAGLTVDGQSINRFEALATDDWTRLPTSAMIASAALGVWLFVIKALIAAFVINILLATQTWVYLILRAGADGTELDEVYLEEPTPAEQSSAAAGATPDKVEPTKDDAATEASASDAPESAADTNAGESPSESANDEADSGGDKPAGN